MKNASMYLQWIFWLAVSLALAPLMSGVINKVKAFFAGRNGPPLFQLYFDLAKLARKNPVRSSSGSWVLACAPFVGFASTVGAALFFPFAATVSPMAFHFDVVIFFYLLGLARMASVLGAFDTASAFEGMGASRELQFSALVECVIFAILPFVVLLTGRCGCFSLSTMLPQCGVAAWSGGGVATMLAAAAFFIVLLVECCRVPFDDPETHLELTMIHEAMILDYAGPDLALILYTAALKMWLLASFLVLMVVPVATLGAWSYFAGVALVAVAVGVMESVMARFKFLKSPQTILGAFALGLIAVTLLVSFKK